MIYDKSNIQENVDRWVKRKIYTKEQGDVIISACLNGFNVNVGPPQIPASHKEPIIQKVQLTLILNQ